MAKLDLDILTVRTGSTTAIKSSTKVLQKGELLVDTNSSDPQLFIGDGTTQVKNLKSIKNYILPKLYWADQEVSLNKSTQKIPTFGGINIVDEYNNKLVLLTKDYLYVGALGQPTNYIKNAYINNINTNAIKTGSNGTITIGNTYIASNYVNTPRIATSTITANGDATFGTKNGNYTCTIYGNLDLTGCTVKGLKIGSGSSFAGFKIDENSIYAGSGDALSAWSFWHSGQTGTISASFDDWYSKTTPIGWIFRIGTPDTGFGVRYDMTAGGRTYWATASKITASQIFGAVQTTSDKQLKKDINNLDEKYDTLFNNLQPVSFKYKDGHRTHVGFIAQDIKEAMNKANMSNEDFAAYCEDKKDSGIECSLRYDEFIAINTMQIKKLKDEVKELKEQINKLTKTKKKKEVTE